MSDIKPNLSTYGNSIEAMSDHELLKVKKTYTTK
jgi:hypothetical protein